MIASGLQIYIAYRHFGLRGEPSPLPNPLDGQPIPQWARLGGWLAGGLNWHFALAWPFVITGLVYLVFLALSGEWRSLLFRPRDVGPAVAMQLYYLRLRKDHPPQGKHNALQKGAYTFIVALGAVSALSGFAIYKPVQLAWLTALFGGYELARYWHFLSVWIFVGFTLLHVAARLRGGPRVAARHDHRLVPGEVSEPWLSACPDWIGGPPAPGHRRRPGDARRLWLEWLVRCSSRSFEPSAASTIGSGSTSFSRQPAGGAVPRVGAHGAGRLPVLLDHPQPTGHSRRSSGSAALELRVEGLVRKPREPQPRRPRAAAARHLHGQAPLRRGVDGGGDLDRRGGLDAGGDGGAGRTGRDYIRFDSFDSKYFNGWDLKSAMHPQTILAYAWNDRPLQLHRRRSAPPLLADQAGLQADQVSHGDDVHQRTAGRLLGGPGLSVVRRRVRGWCCRKAR